MSHTNGIHTTNNNTIHNNNLHATTQTPSHTNTLTSKFTTPKLINDPIHGHIELNPILFRIIDTVQFQRLRDLHQLGTAHLVFPGASHTRFEHSLGVCYLAGQLMRHIQRIQSHLVTEQDILIVQIAGLCHDLGHGPFSHIFDGEFLPQIWQQHGKDISHKSTLWSHEIGSIMLLDQIYIENVHKIQEYINTDELALIKQLIVNTKSDEQPLTEKLFLYEIVANARNGVDVDKFDYLLRDSFYTKVGFSNNFQSDRLIKSIRVIKNEICYNIKDSINLYELFSTRYKLHKMCYSHRVCKAIEYMIVDIMKLAEPIFHYSEQITDPRNYLHLTDNVIAYIEQYDESLLHNNTTLIQQLNDAKQLIYRLKIRKLYKQAVVLTIPPNAPKVRPITAQMILDNDTTQLLTLNDVIVQNLKLNYALNEKNPVRHIHFYHKRNINIKFQIKAEEVSIMIPQFFEERIIRVFLRQPTIDKIDAAQAALHKLFNYQSIDMTEETDIDDTASIHSDATDVIENMLNDIDENSVIESPVNKKRKHTHMINRTGSTGLALIIDSHKIPRTLLYDDTEHVTDELNSSTMYPTPVKPKPKHKFASNVSVKFE